jgi:peptidylprolyl isomerase
MSKAKIGDLIKVHYTGKLEDGTVFDSSVGREPLEFTLGNGNLIRGFEVAVEGMEVGGKTTTTIPAEEAYGASREDMIVQVPMDQVPPQIEPQVGMQLNVQQQDGQEIPVRVIEVTESFITLDANHPLAGKTLVFDIEVVEIA